MHYAHADIRALRAGRIVPCAIARDRMIVRGMQIHVRDSRDDDIAAIVAIYGHAVVHGNASFELDPPDTAEMARRRHAILQSGYPYLVAERDCLVIGYAYAGPYRARPAYRFAVENSIYVAPEAHGTGTGRVLLPALIARCSAAGFRLMVAVIGDSANQASIRLHAANGFSHAGLLPNIGWKHGRWLDSVLMTLPLGPGASTTPD